MACVFCDGTLVAFETPIFSYTMVKDFHFVPIDGQSLTMNYLNFGHERLMKICCKETFNKKDF